MRSGSHLSEAPHAERVDVGAGDWGRGVAPIDGRPPIRSPFLACSAFRWAPGRLDTATALSRREPAKATAPPPPTWWSSPLARPRRRRRVRHPKPGRLTANRSGAEGVCGWLAAGYHYPRRTWGRARTPVTVARRDRQRVTSSRGGYAKARRTLAVPLADPGLGEHSRGNRMASHGAPRVRARGTSKAGCVPPPPERTPLPSNYSGPLAGARVASPPPGGVVAARRR